MMWPGRMLWRQRQKSSPQIYRASFPREEALQMNSVHLSGLAEDETAPQATLHPGGAPAFSSSCPGRSGDPYSYCEALLLICHSGSYVFVRTHMRLVAGIWDVTVVIFKQIQSNKSVQPSRFTHCNLSANVATTGYRQKSQSEARTDGSLMFWMKLLTLWPSKHKPLIIPSTKSSPEVWLKYKDRQRLVTGCHRKILNKIRTTDI